MKILAIDPGTTESGWCVFDTDTFQLLAHGIDDNNELRKQISRFKDSEDDDKITMAIEMVASYGMPVGESTFHTVRWIGRFQERFEKLYRPDRVHLITRQEVKMCLCHQLKGVNDSVIRRRVLDIFPATGGGKTPQIGTKKEPGPLYGVKSHIFAAIAVALTCAKVNYGFNF